MNQPNIAFVFIGCGPYARTYKCEMAIESLCKVAQWQGKVYLASDSPECYDIEQIRSNASNEHIHLVEIENFSNKFDSPFAFSSRPPFIHPIPAKKVVKSKMQKAALFDLVDDDVDIAIYCDSDLLFAREDLTENIIEFASNWSNDDHHLKISRSIGSGEIHSGFLIAHRKHSKALMQLWKENMMNQKLWNKNPYDRTKFEVALKSLSEKNESINLEQLPEYAEKFFSPGKELAFATHFSIARILNNEHQMLIDFIDDLNLKSCSAEDYVNPKMSKIARYLWYLAYLPYAKNEKIEDKA